MTAISHKVIGCARDVHMALGPGFEASVYAEALKIQLDAHGVAYAVNTEFPVVYKGKRVGSASADLFIADRFVVQVMAKPSDVSGYDRAVARAVLKAGGLELGLIINFAGRLLKDGLVRVLNPDRIAALGGGDPEDEGQAEPGGDGEVV